MKRAFARGRGELVRALGLAFLCGGCLMACAAPAEQIVQTAAGRRASDLEVDGDPWRLLPGGAVAWFRFDPRSLSGVTYESDVNRLLLEHLPLSDGQGFQLTRDVEETVLGVYATAGADVAAVARGTFDAAQIEAAIEKKPSGASGRPILKTTFAGRVVYVADGWAMVPVTSRTLVFGTEVGVRRVIERIEEGRIQRSLPAWYEQMLEVKGAGFAWGIDLDAQPVPSTVRTKLDFLSGLRAGRLLGNFESPGLNLAGTLSYDSPDSAQKASVSLENWGQTLRVAGLVGALQSPSGGGSIRRLEARATGKETQVAVEVDERLIQTLLRGMQDLLQ